MTPTERTPRPDQTHRLITGGTGFMGSHFLLGLYRKAGRTTALVRGKSGADAAQRLEGAVEGAACALGVTVDKALWDRRVDAVVGDICADNCGVAPADEARLAQAGGVRELWHLAASLQFELRSRDSIFNHNVGGTRNALALAIRLGCQRFVYVSTAYTAGRASGTIAEELHDKAGPFNNLYEESKCLAEHEVAATCAAHGIDFRILRPSIIVGPSTTLNTGGSDSGLYGFASELYRLRGQFQRMGRSITVEGDPATPLNLIPIDWAVRDLLHLAQTGFAGAGRILHLTAPGGVPIEAVGEIIAKHAQTPSFDIAGSVSKQRAPIEVLFDRRTTFYGGYLKGAKRFARSLRPHGRVGPEQVDGYIRELFKELRGETRAHVFDRSNIPGFDGTPLCAYAANPVPTGDAAQADRPTVVLVNAYGMPADIMLPLACALRGRFRVLTWESRGLPNLALPFDARTASVGDHAMDLQALLDFHGVARAHLVGWCTGAQVALRFASAHPGRVKKLALLNGCYSLPPQVPITEYRELIRELMAEVAANPSFADAYYELIYGKSSRPGVGTPAAGADTVASVLNFTEPELLHLTSAPFHSPEAIHRYAVMVSRFYEEPDHAWTVGVSAPTLLVTGEKDFIAHPAETQYVAGLLPRSTLLSLPEGTHFSMHHDAKLLERVASFLGDTDAGADAGHKPPAPPVAARPSRRDEAALSHDSDLALIGGQA